MERMDDAARRARETVTAFAKVSPEQKARVIRALHRRAMSSAFSETASTTARR